MLEIYSVSFIEWYWKCFLYGYIQKGFAIVAAIFSFCVVWSELTFFNQKPVLSIFAVIVSMAGEKYDYFTIEVNNFLIWTVNTTKQL